MLSALMIGAQTKIAPKMKKGDKKVYVTESTISVPTQKAVKITAETTFEVTDATSDGYVLDVYVTDIKTDATNAESRFYSMATEMLKGIHTLYTTNKEGKVEKILDVEVVKKRTNDMLDKILSDVPVPESTNKSDLRDKLMGNINEESLLQSVQMSTSPLALNGKTISTGTEEEFINKQTELGLKMKRIYTLNSDGSIKATSTLDMSAEEMKNLLSGLLGQLTSNLPDGFDQYLSSMMKDLKLESSEQSTYTLQKDGWVKGIVSEMTTSCMGQKITMSTKVTLK